MMISLQEYRARIGQYFRNRRNSPKVSIKLKKYKSDNIVTSTILYCLLISDIISPLDSKVTSSSCMTSPSPPSRTSTLGTLLRTCLAPSTSTDSREQPRNPSRHCHMSTNKLMKMVNGNRAKAGFKHSQWNIDKGLFTMGKLDDIKVKLFRLSLIHI